VLGLGHLGNAYLWALATLPYEDQTAVEFALLDFDKIERVNVVTGVVFMTEFLKRFKTRACDAWLARRNFRTRLVERRFDVTFQISTGFTARRGRPSRAAATSMRLRAWLKVLLLVHPHGRLATFGHCGSRR
jgi:hypothetical protein